jgi:hypothetical protein
MKDESSAPAAIFKPVVEEAYAPLNPRGYQASLGSPGFRNGILSGESAFREYAAWILDINNFSGVPDTTLARLQHPGLQGRGY